MSTNKIFFTLLVAGTVYFVTTWSISSSQIKKICKNANQNQNISEIKAQLNNSWLLKYKDGIFQDKNTLLIHSGSNFGRHTCSIEHKDGKIIDSSYIFLD